MGPVRFIVFSTRLVDSPRSRCRSESHPAHRHRRSAPRGAIAAAPRRLHPAVSTRAFLTLVIIIFFVTVIELPATDHARFCGSLPSGAVRAAGQSHPSHGRRRRRVAYFAHVGGFVFGLLAIRLFATSRKQIPPPYPVY